MRIDTHSVVYFINEEYGVVIRANGATKEVAMWDGKRKCFGRRVDLLTASFLARTDRYEGKWCAAHPTCSRETAEKVAQLLVPCLPAHRSAPQGALRRDMTRNLVLGHRAIPPGMPIPNPTVFFLWEGWWSRFRHVSQALDLRVGILGIVMGGKENAHGHPL